MKGRGERRERRKKPSLKDTPGEEGGEEDSAELGGLNMLAKEGVETLAGGKSE